MKNFWREPKILPSEQVRLTDLLRKYGSEIVLEEIDHLIKAHKIPKRNGESEDK